MASVVKRHRLVNPGKKKRKLNALQKLFFGSKRQRAAVKANKGRKRNSSVRRSKKAYKKVMGPRKVHKIYKRKRKRNVGSIVTVFPFGNPGKRKRYTTKQFHRKSRSIAKMFGGKYTVARKRKRNRSTKKVVIINKGEYMARSRRRKRSVGVRRYRRRRNPVYRGRIKRGVYKYTSNPGRRRSYRRRRNPSVRRVHRRRRNPGMLTGTVGNVVGVLGGVAVTKLLAGFLPASFASGPMNYLGIGAIAVLQGKLIGKVSKSSQLGHNMMIGGLAYLTAKVLTDFFPSFGSYTGISGMGLIGGSSFYNPQVNQMGNMGAFVLPSSVAGAIPPPAAKAGMGTLRRQGRLM